MSRIKCFFLMLLLILSFSVALPAHAAFCRNYNKHQICIIDIKRSAKNYWEYRAIVSVDGVKRPIKVYNCRDRTQVLQNGTTLPFAPNDSGNLICKLLN